METQKIYLAGNGSNADSTLSAAVTAALQNKGIDPSTLLAMNGGGFGGWGNNSLMDLIILFALFGGWGNGGWGFGGNNNRNGDSSAEREMLLSAIQRNGLDINNLASSINCSVGQVNNGINALASQICNLSSQNGQSALQIINAIQAGNQTLASQLAQCCCDNKLLVTQQGYENQLAIANQTNALGSKIDAQTTLINDKFCQQEMREMQNKIDALREENSTYKTSAMTSQIVGQAVAPLNAAVAGIQAEVAGIKCKLPEMVSVPADKGVYLNQCTAAALGLGIGLPFFGAYGNGNYSLWG